MSLTKRTRGKKPPFYSYNYWVLARKRKHVQKVPLKNELISPLGFGNDKLSGSQNGCIYFKNQVTTE
jgi:hypothetical protein